MSKNNRNKFKESASYVHTVCKKNKKDLNSKDFS